MKHLALMLAAAGAFAGALGSVTAAQSPNYMTEYCMSASQGFYQEGNARSETKYEGQRTDGTHAVNGTIYLENQSKDFQCSFNASGDTMVDFYADGKSWPAFARNGDTPHAGNGGATAGAGPSTSTEKVRFPAGSSSFQFPAQLPPNSTVRYVLGANKDQFLTTRVSPQGRSLEYRILNPDGSALLDAISTNQEYRGQLWQSGEHIVEVINRSDQTVPFEIFFQIE
ncbi:hypothetical protein [Albibacillus kandeliae]|uniref:hypothetical protein n=1 Tax=Albibacillus kandeliae TaxID=2174228 RepID=UPI0013007DAD|nr:hypothetical protein [Albibacillus kandeliae]